MIQIQIQKILLPQIILVVLDQCQPNGDQTVTENEVFLSWYGKIITQNTSNLVVTLIVWVGYE